MIGQSSLLAAPFRPQQRQAPCPMRNSMAPKRFMPYLDVSSSSSTTPNAPVRPVRSALCELKRRKIQAARASTDPFKAAKTLREKLNDCQRDQTDEPMPYADIYDQLASVKLHQPTVEMLKQADEAKKRYLGGAKKRAFDELVSRERAEKQAAAEAARNAARNAEEERERQHRAHYQAAFERFAQERAANGLAVGLSFRVNRIPSAEEMETDAHSNMHMEYEPSPLANTTSSRQPFRR